MPDTKLKSKIFLILFGSLVCFLLLESGLRFGGWLFHFIQERSNAATFQGQEIRILCIGESTTAIGGRHAYPSLLEDILNQRRPDKKFKVINKGMVSKTSKDIAQQIEMNLFKYRPAIVISMLGINDHALLVKESRFHSGIESFITEMRTYKLFRLLKQHLVAKFSQGQRPAGNVLTGLDTGNPGDDTRKAQGVVQKCLSGLSEMEKARQKFEFYLQNAPDSATKAKMQVQLDAITIGQYQVLLLLAHNYRVLKNYQEAERYLKIAVALKPGLTMAYTELGRCQMEKKDYPQAIEFLSKAIVLDPKNSIAYMELARSYDELGSRDKTLAIYQKVLADQDLIGRQGNRDIANWLIENGYYQLAEKVYLKAIAENAQDYYLYEQLAEVYQKIGLKEAAEFYAAKAGEIREQQEEYLPETVKNYQRIANAILPRKIPLIVMQYPLKSVAPLKRIFRGDQPIVFVENKLNFEAALTKGEYSEYFNDSFGGVFGHCTGLGNQLIAENVADTILRDIIK